ncbi:hypothetical protein GCM10020258_14640 [Sphingomonas yabuuchiae]
MRLFSRVSAPLIVMGALSLSAPAFAQDATVSSNPAAAEMAGQLGKNTITVGLAGAYLPDYEGSNDYQFTPAPAALAYIDGHTITYIGNRVSVDLIGDKANRDWDIQAGPIGVVNLDRTAPSRIDDPASARWARSARRSSWAAMSASARSALSPAPMTGSPCRSAIAMT